MERKEIIATALKAHEMRLNSRRDIRDIIIAGISDMFNAMPDLEDNLVINDPDTKVADVSQMLDDSIIVTFMDGYEPEENKQYYLDELSPDICAKVFECVAKEFNKQHP